MKKTPQAPQAAEAPAEAASKFSYEAILMASSRFGVKPEVIAGALHEGRKAEYTIAEVEAAIEKFKTKEVK